MRATLICLFALNALAQDNSLLTVVHGSLLEWDSDAKHGQLSVRGVDYAVQRCLFDEHSYFANNNLAIAPTQLVKGQELEIIADRNGPRGQCYARTVRTVELAVQKPKPYVSRTLPLSSYGYSSALDAIMPRGNLTFAGVIVRINPESMVLHTRADGDRSFVLRQDTRYLHGGSPAASSSLQINDRVFVRAGKNFEDELEAFQVVWGEILRPRE